MTRNPDIDVVFFDAGETILRPYPSFPELFADLCGRHGADVEPAEVARVQEELAPHLVDLAEDSGVENPSLSPEASRNFWTFLYRRFLEELGINVPGLEAELFAVFSATSTYRLFDDVLPVLARLQREGYRLGLISNFEGWLAEMLTELQVGEIFETTVISGAEGVEKPDPRIYRIALERAGVEAARSVHVGDSMGLDVEPATQVGIHAVLVDRVGRYEGRHPRTIASLEELPALLTKL